VNSFRTSSLEYGYQVGRIKQMIEVGISGTRVLARPEALDLIARGGPTCERGADGIQISQIDEAVLVPIVPKMKADESRMKADG
jgi:hypothetical protein